MKIKVIGGLGYLGSIVCDMLKARKHEVLIEDICLWDNREVSNSIKDCKAVFGNTTIDNETFDLILCCYHIDYINFYCQKNFTRIYKNHKPLLDSLSSGKRVINIVDHQYFFNPQNPIYLDYVSSHLKLKNENIENIVCPSLFGASLRMRWDTPINEMYLSMIMNKSCALEGLTAFNSNLFVSVVDMAEYIVERIEYKPEFQKSLTMPYTFLSDLSTIASVMKTFNKEEEISVDILGEMKSETIETKDMQLIKVKESATIFSELKNFVEIMNKNLENNSPEEFMKDKFNNRTMLDNVNQYKNLVKNLE